MENLFVPQHRYNCIDYFLYRHNRSRWRPSIPKFLLVLDYDWFIRNNSNCLNSIIQLIAKEEQIKRKPINQTLCTTKSTTLNPMFKSDLVNSCDGTVPFLIKQAANNAKNSLNGESPVIIWKKFSESNPS